MSIKDNYLNPIELAGLYHAAINGTVSKNDLSETQRLQLLKFAKDKKQDIEFGIFETINSGKLTPSMYKNDLTAFIEKQSVLPQSVIDWLSETTLKPNPNNPLKLEFTSRKIKEFVLELSEFGGDENPVTYLNAWLEKLQSIGIKTFEYECLITIYHAFKENASLFWNNSHMNNIKEWLISNNAGIHPIDFGNVWDEVSRIKRIYTNKNSIYKAEFDKLKIESEAIEQIDEKIKFWAKKLAKFKQNLSFETLNASGNVVAYTKVNAPLFLDRLIEEEIKYLNTIRDLNTQSDKPKQTKVLSITAPEIALFCELVHDAKLNVRGYEETVEVYCMRICGIYNLKYTDRVRQNYGGVKSKKHYDKVKNVILKQVDADTRKAIQEIIDRKLQGTKKMYG